MRHSYCYFAVESMQLPFGDEDYMPLCKLHAGNCIKILCSKDKENLYKFHAE